MAVLIGSARIDERGRASGGQAGDQTGKEVSTQNWYAHSKGWRTFRCTDPEAAGKIAACMRWACANPKIGYDQSQNTSLYKALDKVGFDLDKLTDNVETDCARLVRVCVRYAGIQVKDFYTASEASALLATGCFRELTGAKYNKSSDYLREGDIQVTKTKGHTIVVLSNGPKAAMDKGEPEPEYKLGERILRNGDEGADVKELQLKLIELGFTCGEYGADGEFGDNTELAVRAFQKRHGCEIDGEVGEETLSALLAELDADSAGQTVGKYVTIGGGNCYVRKGPGTQHKALTVVYKGQRWPYMNEQSPDGWLRIKIKDRYQDIEGWVSGKYGKLI